MKRRAAFQLGIENGTVVTPRGRRRANVYVSDGKVAALTSERQPADEVRNADGLLVLPGMVDAHVHLMDPVAQEREDFPTGTAAAARAGVTSLVEHTHLGPVRNSADLRAKVDYLQDRSRIDFALAAHSWPDETQAVAEAWQAGAAFIKAFMTETHGVPAHNAAHLQQLFSLAASCGAVCLVHCEDDSITGEAERSLRQAYRSDGAVIFEWRNREAELVAASTASLLARKTGARVVIAHASNPDVLGVAVQQKAQGADLWVESCPQYFTLFEHESIQFGALRKFTPPARARSQADLDRMWQLLAEGEIDLVSSDHAPSTRAQKEEGSIWEAHFGLPGIDTTMSVLLDGAHRGLISYERVVEVYSERPAMLYGLYPAKGRLGVGADADVVLVDPESRWLVSDADIVSKAGWSPFSGRTLFGRAVATYLRGKLVASDGHVVAEPGTGRFLPGLGAQVR